MGRSGYTYDMRPQNTVSAPFVLRMTTAASARSHRDLLRTSAWRLVYPQHAYEWSREPIRLQDQ